MLTIPVTVPQAGLHAVDFRYFNGNGPINTENKCALRTLRQGQQQLGTIVMPQRGVAEWSNWGFTNSVLVRLEKGPQPLNLAVESANELYERRGKPGYAGLCAPDAGAVVANAAKTVRNKQPDRHAARSEASRSLR